MFEGLDITVFANAEPAYGAADGALGEIYELADPDFVVAQRALDKRGKESWNISLAPQHQCESRIMKQGIAHQPPNFFMLSDHCEKNSLACDIRFDVQPRR